MSDDWREGGYIASMPAVPFHPEEFARAFARRPGMYLGAVTFERAVGFILGLETALIWARRTTQEAADLPTQRFSALVRRDPGDDEHEAIIRLEPVLTAVLTELREAHGGART